MTTTFDKATQVVQRLRDAGYLAYFAGGWVRDYLLDRAAPDIDIATAAPPEVVVKLFSHTVEVGAAFGVVMVIWDNEPFEVATFRKDGLYLYGRRPEAVEYSTAEEDAQRRDFTINGMFYDPLSGEIMDYVGGRQDLAQGIVRAIGDPHERFKEDRLRMVRGVRIMARFHFALERQTRDAIAAHAETLLPSVAMERIWQEFCKMAEHSGLSRALVTMHELGLLQTIFPHFKDVGLDEMIHRIRHLKEFPHPCPAILCLAQIFSEATETVLSDLCTYLRASNKDAELAAWYLHVKSLCERTVYAAGDEVEWVQLYADPRTALCLQVYQATLDKEKRQACYECHHHAQNTYALEIGRIRDRQPVVTSQHLFQAGVSSGKGMGLLLKEAERLSITERLSDANVIIERLKETDLWPQGRS